MTVLNVRNTEFYLSVLIYLCDYLYLSYLKASVETGGNLTLTNCIHGVIERVSAFGGAVPSPEILTHIGNLRLRSFT